MSVSIYSRYYGLESVTIRGRTSLERRPPIDTEPPPGSIQHRLIAGETLELLAARYYGREDLWWRIADANPARFPLDWEPGETLVIPPISVATRTPRR